MIESVSVMAMVSYEANWRTGSDSKPLDTKSQSESLVEDGGRRR